MLGLCYDQHRKENKELRDTVSEWNQCSIQSKLSGVFWSVSSCLNNELCNSCVESWIWDLQWIEYTNYQDINVFIYFIISYV